MSEGFVEENIDFWSPESLSLSHSGNLLLWVGIRRRASTSFSQEQLTQS